MQTMVLCITGRSIDYRVVIVNTKLNKFLTKQEALAKSEMGKIAVRQMPMKTRYLAEFSLQGAVVKVD